jgi:hypothetical protein
VSSTRELPATTEPQVLPPSTGEINTWDQELRGAARDYKRVLAKIAWYGARLYITQSFPKLGYPSEEAYVASIDIPYSTYAKWRRIGVALFDLSLTDLMQIPATNLEMLIGVNSDLRPQFDWVSEAKVQEPREFAQTIVDRNLANGDGKEPMDWIRYRVPFLAKQMIEQAIAEFQARYELASPGRALELLVADKFDRDSLLGSVIEVRTILRRMESYMDSAGVLEGPFARDMRGALTNAKDILGEAYSKAIQAARETVE